MRTDTGTLVLPGKMKAACPHAVVSAAFFNGLLTPDPRLGAAV